MKNVILTIVLLFVALLTGCNSKSNHEIEKEVQAAESNFSYNELRKQSYFRHAMLLFESEGSAQQIWALGEERFLHEVAHRYVVEMGKRAKVDAEYNKLYSKYNYAQLYKAAEKFGPCLLEPEAVDLLDGYISLAHQN